MAIRNDLLSKIVSSLSFLFSGDTVKNTSRVKTDDQPTSYEENKQFKIFHRMIGVATTGQIVFKFSTLPALNIIERNITAWGGGREYLVIPDTGQYPAVDALLTTSVKVRNVNGNLEDSGLPVHPTSGVTVDYGVLTGADQIPIANGDQFPNGDVISVNEGGFLSVTNSQISNSVNKSGVAAGQAFYLVFRNISSDVFDGQFFLQWEER